MTRNTKIIATLGPAVGSFEAIEALADAGMDAARLNFSYGDHDTHRQYAEWVRKAAADRKRAVAIIQDIQGPKIRVGRFPEGQVELEAEALVRLAAGDGVGDASLVFVGYPRLTSDVRVGERVVLADGLVRLEVVDRTDDHLVARVVQGGTVADHRGAAFPDSHLAMPAITDKDREDLEFGKELDVDFVAASFVESADDIEEVRRLAGVPVIAKVERAVAYRNLDEIIAAADGIMVARGDLGVELPLEELPFVQADILRRSNAAGRVTITATEMLESMKQSTRPTRAEVTDVTNAVLEGTDAVMLSGETAAGEHPTEVVRTMSRILDVAERHPLGHGSVEFVPDDAPIASATAKAAVAAAEDLDITTIVAFTETGGTARLLSKYRPQGRIWAFSPDQRTRRRVALYWGVTPVVFDRLPTTDEMIAAADRHLQEAGLCVRGTRAVMVAGTPPNRRASTNLMKIHVVGKLS